MTTANVISLGEAIIDRLGPIGGDPACDQPLIDCYGGAPANVACALSRLGVQVSFVGSLGNDYFGKNFKQLMIKKGINVSGLQQDNCRPTRIVLVRRDAAGERSFGGFEGDEGLGFADQALLKEKLVKDWPLVVGQAKWLIIGSIPLASEISSEAFFWCIENSCKSGIKIALDLNWRPTFWRKGESKEFEPLPAEKQKIYTILKHTSLIKLAKEEAELFFDSTNPSQISSTLSHHPSVIVTDGSKPVSWILNKHHGESNAILPDNVIDTTGAGDAFTAGLIYKLLPVDLDKIDIKLAQEIIQFSIACGAYVCQGVGAIESQPYPDDVEKLLSRTRGGII